MNPIATFEKVSLVEYTRERLCTIDLNKLGITMEEFEAMAKKEWEALELPTRSTQQAAGYDFHLPFDVAVSANSVTIPTGIRCKMKPGWCLILMPRSGLGFKYGMALENTLALIDGDYVFSPNEGHIMAKVHTRNKVASLKQGDRFIQGILLPFGIATNGNTENTRTGGIGSTGA